MKNPTGCEALAYSADKVNLGNVSDLQKFLTIKVLYD